MSESDESLEAPEEEAPSGESEAPGKGRWSDRLPLQPRKLAVVALVLAVATGAAFWLLRDPGPTPGERLRMALELLEKVDDISSREQAREIAKELEQLGYRDPDFAGGVEFVLGIVAFRTAEDLDETSQEQQYLVAVQYLQEAERRALDATHRTEWAYALGTSFYRIGASNKARPLLEEALASYEPGPTRIRIAMLLTDIYLDVKGPEELERALQMNDEVIKSADSLTASDRDRAYLQRAQILLALKRNDEAEAALEKVSRQTSGNQGTIVFRARTLMAEGKYSQAFQLLEPVARYRGLDNTYPRQALYLMSVCAERLGDTEKAIFYYEQTARQYPDSHEGLDAYVRAGDLLRRAGRDEEALEAYRRALAMVKDPAEFRNRWRTLESFRQAMLDAWKDWIRRKAFDKAIALAGMMGSAFEEVQALEFVALANRQWAESLEAAVAEAPYSRRAALVRKMREQWRASGDAYARLAEAVRTTSRYGDELWTSAEHYRKGHDFENALNQLTRFINTRPKRLLPTALVWRGRILMDLDRLDEALENFQRVLVDYPKDPARFEAQFAIGRCYLERGQLEEAENAWRRILAASDLTPDAEEWRRALFSLGRLLYHKGAMKHAEADGPRGASLAEKDREALLQEAFTLWEEATRRLEEYLERYPRSPESYEARYLLAKSLQRATEAPRRRLATAETENARMELRRTMQQELSRALAEFQRLRTDLLRLQEQDRLDELGQKLLRDCHFEIAHTYYALERFEEAIAAYHGAANRYPQSAQVLLAYVQMANCNDRLGRPAEARSMLEQAKVILKQMPDETFDEETNMTRQEWAEWLDWAGRLHASLESSTATP